MALWAGQAKAVPEGPGRDGWGRERNVPGRDGAGKVLAVTGLEREKNHLQLACKLHMIEDWNGTFLS
ncbi:hypothetical protein PPACK8108_LOCUS7649 [Phakopsora pachyrhizi]|uniref:Uncharacterized protein n=1 Tax=Phakopsora pachyrhizi TaxID=170000 RepID=A0AAV0ATE7_PHAPC|nr:hypothetical protein PPACK8108_LOCUS7649 [Phakopsora pachyrhizi]